MWAAMRFQHMVDIVMIIFKNLNELSQCWKHYCTNWLVLRVSISRPFPFGVVQCCCLIFVTIFFSEVVSESVWKETRDCSSEVGCYYILL